MQNTRLNSLVDAVGGQIGRWVRNPWRRLSLVTIGLLFGIFLGTAISTTTGQRAVPDAIAALVVVIFTEAASWFVYRSNRRLPQNAVEFEQSRAGSQERSFLADVLNALKIGLTYSLFIEAFKLGS